MSQLLEAPPVDAFVHEEADAKQSRTLLIVALVGAIAVVAFAAWFFVFSHDGTPAPVASPPASTSHVKPSPAASPAASAPAAPIPPTFNRSVGRDPFKALITPPVQTTTASTAMGTTGTTGTTPPAAGAPTTSIKLVSVSADSTSAQATIDGKPYNFPVGQRIDSSIFRVYAIFAGGCAGFQYGDQSFPLCVGDTRSIAKL